MYFQSLSGAATFGTLMFRAMALCIAMAASAQAAPPRLATSAEALAKAHTEPEMFIADEFIVILNRDARSQIQVARDQHDKPVVNLPTLQTRIETGKVAGIARQFPTARAYPEGHKYPDLTGHFIVKIEPDADLNAAMDAFRGDPNVEGVEKIGVHRIDAIPNDSFWGNLWNLKPPFGVDAQAAWDIESGNPAVVVGILDTGVRYYHPDLGGPNSPWGPENPQTNGNIFVNPNETPGSGVDDDSNGRIDDTIGYDFLTSTLVSGCTCIDSDCGGADNDPEDHHGHGTHVAGTVSAMTNNALGVAGVAGGFGNGTSGSSGNGVKVMPLRMGWSANCTGIGNVGLVSMSAAAAAMNYVATMVDQGHNITAINCSWGSSNTGGISSALAAVVARDVVVVKAAGNSNSSTPDFLGSQTTVTAVGGTTITGAGYSSSNHGSWVDIAAPAVNVLSTTGNSYATFTGTSMAAPHVAGVAALLESCRPSLTRQEKVDIMVQTSIPYSDPRDLGEGIVNAFNAIQICLENVKFDQPPAPSGETIASQIDWSDNTPNTVVADDFVSDGRPISGLEWWGGPLPEFPTFRLDDGQAENSVGVNDGQGTGGTFGWANQFQNNTGGPITLKNIEVAFGAPGGATGVSVGNAVDAVIWIDAAATGDMANATPAIRWSLPGGVHANDGTSFAIHTIPGGGVVIPSGAEFYVGFGDIQSQNDQVVRFPAAIDQSASAGLSWGFFPPDIADPFDENLAGQTVGVIDSFGIAGNWLIRASGDSVPDPDGWFISFHEPLATGGSQETPLGLYFCGKSVVEKSPQSFTSCDGYDVIRYSAVLENCCLIHAEVDSRSGQTPAQPTAFEEEECFEYGLDIQAVAGVSFADSGGTCVETATGNTVDGNFWGWYTSDVESGASFGLQQALESQLTMSGSDWLYGPWSPVTATCAQPNMAFRLITPVVVHGDPDEDGSGVPDICECSAPDAVLAEPTPVIKNRYLSVEPQNTGIETAIRVTLVDLPDFPGSNGEVRWVGPPQVCQECTGAPFTAASLQCSPHCMDWGAVGLVDILGIEVVPGSTYEVDVLECPCGDPGNPSLFSAPLIVETSACGDVVAPFGTPNFGDVSAVLDSFRCVAGAPRKARCQLQPSLPNPCSSINFGDVSQALNCFQGIPHTFTGPGTCP
jgi:subtilisin family serine protease